VAADFRDLILVDRSLELYGPETTSPRRALRAQVAGLINEIESVSATTPKLHALSDANLNDFYQVARRLSLAMTAREQLKLRCFGLGSRSGRSAHLH
jgi:hypothetical protein